MDRWTKATQDRFFELLTDYWPQSVRTPGGSLRSGTLQRWLEKLQQFESAIVFQALAQLKEEETRDWLPGLGQVAELCARLQSAESQRHENRRRTADFGTGDPPRSVTQDPAWWREREQLPEPTGSFYRRQRERLAGGRG